MINYFVSTLTKQQGETKMNIEALIIWYQYTLEGSLLQATTEEFSGDTKDLKRKLTRGRSSSMITVPHQVIILSQVSKPF